MSSGILKMAVAALLVCGVLAGGGWAKKAADANQPSKPAEHRSYSIMTSSVSPISRNYNTQSSSDMKSGAAA